MYRDAVNSLAILSPQACKQATDTILSLDQHWICPNSDFFLHGWGLQCAGVL